MVDECLCKQMVMVMIVDECGPRNALSEVISITSHDKRLRGGLPKWKDRAIVNKDGGVGECGTPFGNLLYILPNVNYYLHLSSNLEK